MKTAKITMVHQIAHHQYGQQGETVYNVSLNNGRMGWIVGFGGDHYLTSDQDIIATFDNIRPPQGDENIVGTEVEVPFETYGATISVVSIGRGHYKWTVHLDGEEYTMTNTDSRSYDTIHRPDPDDDESIEAKKDMIRSTLEDNDITVLDVRHEHNPHYGVVFDVDVR